MMQRNLTDALRLLVTVIEVGTINSEQHRLLQYVKAVLGDEHEPFCAHANTAYESAYQEDDVLVCQDCRVVLPRPI